MHEFGYSVQPIPPGRLPFHRWRWELWHGAWMIGAGWGTAPAAAERALVRAATRRVHELRGVRALHPERARLLEALRPGLPAMVDTGAGACILVPLAEEGLRSAA